MTTRADHSDHGHHWQAGRRGGAHVEGQRLQAARHDAQAGERAGQGACARWAWRSSPGDLDDEASLRKALAGAWGVFAVQNTWEAGVEKEEEQGKRQARLAREAGVQHYVYSSVGSAHKNTGIPHFDNKWRIEETVRGLNFPSHVVLRPVFFMENLLAPGTLQRRHARVGDEARDRDSR